MKRIISLIMAVVSLFCVMSVSAGAQGVDEGTVTVTVNETAFTFDADTTEEFRERFIENYFNGEEDGVTTYGLMCTLFGHKIETTTVAAVTHKAKATSPRCLREIYDVDNCTRCDYTNSTLITSSYIVCCA